ncbi:MAG: hypothetical protein WD491_13640 [Balneolales bacterium]
MDQSWLKLDEVENLYVAEQCLEKPERVRWSLDQLEKGDDLEGCI